MLFSLKGKTVLITGAGGGIGSAMAKSYHSQGATVILADIKEEFVTKISTELKDRNFVLATGDISLEENIVKLAEEAEKFTAGVDILVNNAGITRDKLALRMTKEDWDAVIAINLTTPFLLSKVILSKMMKRGWGRVINVASVVGIMGNAGQANYSASKGGLIALTKTLAREFATRGVTVNAIAPGFIETKMTENLSENARTQMLASIPLGKMGTPKEVADTAVFLSTEEAGYITGQVININGGMVM